MRLEALDPQLHSLYISFQVIVLPKYSGGVEVSLVYLPSLLGDDAFEFSSALPLHFGLFLGDVCLALPVSRLLSKR